MVILDGSREVLHLGHLRSRCLSAGHSVIARFISGAFGTQASHPSTRDQAGPQVGILADESRDRLRAKTSCAWSSREDNFPCIPHQTLGSPHGLRRFGEGHVFARKGRPRERKGVQQREQHPLHRLPQPLVSSLGTHFGACSTV